MRRMSLSLMFTVGLLLAPLAAHGQRLTPAVPLADDPESMISEMTRWQGKVYFCADDGVHGSEPWVSDGTESGTRMLADISPGQGGSRPRAFIDFNNRLYFAANTRVENERSIIQLCYVSVTGEIGTVRQTYQGEELLLAVMPGTSMHVWNGRLLFRAESATSGIRLWTSDGVSEDAELLWCDSNGEALPVRYDPIDVLASVKSLYTVLRNGEIWAASRGLRGMNRVFEYGRENHTAPIALLGDVLLFSHLDAEHGREPYTATAQRASGQLLKDIIVGARNGCSMEKTPSATLNGVVYFSADDGVHGTELHVTDGSPPGTQLFLDLNPGRASSTPNWFRQLGSQIFFTADDGTHGHEPWISDGTIEGTRLLNDLAPGPESSHIHNLVQVGERLFFDATTPDTGEEQFVTDGTPEGTRLFADVLPGNLGSKPAQNEFTDKYLVFTADDGIHGRELWRADLTTGAASMVKNIALPKPGPLKSVRSMTSLGEYLYFVADTAETGMELWQMHGSEESPVLVQDILPGPPSAHPEELTACGGRLYFVAEDSGAGRCIYYIAEGRSEVKRAFAPQAALSKPHSLAMWKELLFFMASQKDTGEELWCLKPPYEEPELIRDICPGECDGRPSNLCATPSGMAFTATDENGEQAFWLTDGTEAGTKPTGRFAPAGDQLR